MFKFPNVSFPETLSVFSSSILLQPSGSEQLIFFHFLALFVRVFLGFYKRFITLLFKGLSHLHTGCFKVFFCLGFSCVVIFSAYSGRVTGLHWSHIVLTVIDCSFTLSSRHLGLG